MVAAQFVRIDRSNPAVGGDLSGLFPLHVTASVSGPIECFRTQASQGTAC